LGPRAFRSPSTAPRGYHAGTTRAPRGYHAGTTRVARVPRVSRVPKSAESPEIIRNQPKSTEINRNGQNSSGSKDFARNSQNRPESPGKPLRLPCGYHAGTFLGTMRVRAGTVRVPCGYRAGTVRVRAGTMRVRAGPVLLNGIHKIGLAERVVVSMNQPARL
jgi:hypothetical protein